MACEFTCDGCGRKAPAQFYSTNRTNWFKPPTWFQRCDENGIQDACSRECIDKISKQTGTSRLVLPL